MKTKGVQKFKKTEIGVIPNNWTVKSLDKIIDLKNGKISPQRNISGKIPVYGSNGIIGFTDKTTSFENSIIIGRVGEYCGSVFFSKVKCWVTDNAITGHAKDNTSSLFLYYLLKNLELNKRRGGSGQPLLNQSSINSIEVVLPIILTEQKAIAKILSDLDSKIELNQKMNKTLEKIAQTVFKSWFVDYEFPDENGNPYRSSGGKMVWNEELGKEIPEGWQNGTLGNLVGIKTGKGLKRDEFNEDGKYSILGANGKLGKTNNYNFDEKLILTGRVGTLGTVYLCEKKCWISDNVLISKPLKKENYYYAFFIMKRLDFESLNRGSTQPLVTQTDLKIQQVILPDENTLVVFHKIAKILLEKIILNNDELKRLSQIRDSLLPKLMSGKIRVPLD